MFDLYYVGLSLLLLSTIIGTVRYKNYKSRFSLFLLTLLYVAVVIEALGYYIWKIDSDDNTWVYILYTFFEFNLIFFMYHSILKELKTKKMRLDVLMGLVSEILSYDQQRNGKSPKY